MSGNDLMPYRPAGELLPADRRPNVLVIRSGRARADDQAPMTTVTRSPAAQQDLTGNVAVPACQAIITGFCAFVLASLVAWACGWSWRVVAVAVGLTVGTSWLWRLRIADALLWIEETLTSANQAPAAEPGLSYMLANPRAAAATVAREAQTEEGQKKHGELLAFVDRCLMAGCAESAHGVKASGPDRDRYCANRDTLLSLGLAAWRNPDRPRGGWRLTASRMRAQQIIERHVLRERA